MASPAETAPELAERSLLAWPGPERHVFLLDRGGERMSETARLAWTSRPPPGRPLRLGWRPKVAPLAGPLVSGQYAERKAEWVRRQRR